MLQAHLGLRCDAPDSTFQGSSSMHSSCARFSTHSQMVMDGRQLAPPNLCGSNHDHGALLDLSACRSPAAGTRLVKKTLQHQTLASSTTSAWSQKTIFSTWHRVPTSFAHSGGLRLPTRNASKLLTVDLVDLVARNSFSCLRRLHSIVDVFMYPRLALSSHKTL